ncbi:MAG: pyridoxamine 5'-phosphate oxidase family protein, partial [Pseudomonadota bacterium]|nr:pyridoxamine 5'-phosphate oxidase family protein [Pseudomonadota bacterium]
RMAVLGSIDQDENVWASVLVGQAGFMQAATEQLVTFDLSKTVGNEDDPFWKNIEDQPQVGMLVIELATRRRLRVNGRIRRSGEQQLELKVLESYPNCPKYIQRRQVTKNRAGGRVATSQVLNGDALGAQQQAIINEADTFFVASAHPERGVDASHRGGNPGFVHIVDDLTLCIPDYTGNCLFNTLGNFISNPRAGLVFIDFELGTTLQLIGRAEILWDEADREEKTGGTQRFWQLHIDRWLHIEKAHELEWSFLDYSPYNPQVSDTSTR